MITLFYSDSLEKIKSSCRKFQYFYEYLINILFRNCSVLKSPCCENGFLTRHAYYRRRFKSRGRSETETLTILRVRCSVCSRTHALLPPELIPYCQCGAESAVSFIADFENGKTCGESLADAGEAFDENDCRRCIKKYMACWKGRIESLKLGIRDFADDFRRGCVLCAKTFLRHFLQMRDPPDYGLVMTT